MFYAFFWYNGRSELIPMERDLDAPKHGYSAKSYIWALEESLLNIYKPGDLYQIDNAPIHTSRLVRE
jgi:hypothetical protein